MRGLHEGGGAAQRADRGMGRLLVTTGGRGESVRRRCAPLCIVLAVLASGCEITPEKKADAINDINKEFRAEYERILAANGVRVYKVGRGEAFAAMRATMLRLGME